MAGAAESNYRQILGIRFFTGSAAEAVKIGLSGGLVVVPAAPALVEIERDKAYREALLNADLVLTDSGFMVLLWNLMKFEKIRRTSGLEYLKLLLEQRAFRTAKSVLWILPTEKSRRTNLGWLKAQGLPVTDDDCYVAPLFEGESVVDPKLLSVIETRRPAQIVIALGGGIQEKLGFYLKKNVSYKPGIHCIGAAIGFLSGEQVNIRRWADHFFLGWLFRCVSQPTKFLPRYWKARRLLAMMLKYRERLPG
jgi:UDP-N-acetyl-D-mannosaminuronic acid transferase (WecB/TagA/CpsF family)